MKVQWYLLPIAIDWNEVGCPQKGVQVHHGPVSFATHDIGAYHPKPSHLVTPHPCKPLNECTGIVHIFIKKREK